MDYLNAFPFVVFAFAGQPWVLGVYEGLERRNAIRAYKLLERAITFILFVLICMGLFG